MQFFYSSNIFGPNLRFLLKRDGLRLLVYEHDKFLTTRVGVNSDVLIGGGKLQQKT